MDIFQFIDFPHAGQALVYNRPPILPPIVHKKGEGDDEHWK